MIELREELSHPPLALHFDFQKLGGSNYSPITFSAALLTSTSKSVSLIRLAGHLNPSVPYLRQRQQPLSTWGKYQALYMTCAF